MEGESKVGSPPSNEEENAATRYFLVRGKVQNVMFRQTIIRAMTRRGLQGGATNDASDKTLVHLTMKGPAASIDELVQKVGSGKPLNDWGALASEVKEVFQGNVVDSHQVTTSNVDMKRWNPNCKMFI